ncbi:Peptide deformylase, mitochondrial [Exaiptasia diaphana]|nr:Peptide deformylase, mitochondrial [Exaiptasia diaphana]
MRSHNGAGIAAPQIGVGLQVIAMEYTGMHIKKLKDNGFSDKELKRMGIALVPLKVFINPRLKIIDPRMVAFREGCLSLEGFSALVPRAREVETADVSESVAIALLAQNHGLTNQVGATGQAPTAPGPRAPSLERLEVGVHMSTEEWNIFLRRCEAALGITDSPQTHLPPRSCFNAPVLSGQQHTKNQPDATGGTAEQLLETMRSLAVIPVVTPAYFAPSSSSYDKNATNHSVLSLQEYRARPKHVNLQHGANVPSFRRQNYSQPDVPTTTQHPTPASPDDQAKEATCPDCKHQYERN